MLTAIEAGFHGKKLDINNQITEDAIVSDVNRFF